MWKAGFHVLNLWRCPIILIEEIYSIQLCAFYLKYVGSMSLSGSDSTLLFLDLWKFLVNTELKDPEY